MLAAVLVAVAANIGSHGVAAVACIASEARAVILNDVLASVLEAIAIISSFSMLAADREL